jgi:hypothetical protein
MARETGHFIGIVVERPVGIVLVMVIKPILRNWRIHAEKIYCRI